MQSAKHAKAETEAARAHPGDHVSSLASKGRGNGAGSY